MSYAGRWRPVHTQCVAVHTGPLPMLGAHWAAVLEAGPRGCLDGTSSLIAGGLEHYSEDVVRVSVPRGVLVRRAPGSRRTADASAASRRCRAVGDPEDTAARGRRARRLWARSDKQATLVLTMVVQQRLTTPERLGAELLTVRRDRRRLLVTTVVTDLVGGVRSLGEHEFAQMCRARGVPEPSRQVLRRGAARSAGTSTCAGSSGVWSSRSTGSSTRGRPTWWPTRYDTTRSQSTVRWCSGLPLLGLRVAADEFFAQIVEALASRGCPVDLAS